jgi:hypothetical protein
MLYYAYGYIISIDKDIPGTLFLTIADFDRIYEYSPGRFVDLLIALNETKGQLI